jgi:hypothetical protein
MNRHPDVADIHSALSWLRSAWTTLPVPPVRLHDRDIEDGSQLGSHRFSSPMWRILIGRPTDEYEASESVMCGHPRLPSANVFDCPDCHGDGYYEHRVRRYRSPMSAALHRLSKMPSPSDGTPAPMDYILALHSTDWNPYRAAMLLRLQPVSEDHWLTIECMFLNAIRQLHSRYSVGPVARVGWVSKSDAQRAAEEAA